MKNARTRYSRKRSDADKPSRRAVLQQREVFKDMIQRNYDDIMKYTEGLLRSALNTDDKRSASSLRITLKGYKKKVSQHVEAMDGWCRDLLDTYEYYDDL